MKSHLRTNQRKGTVAVLALIGLSIGVLNSIHVERPSTSDRGLLQLATVAHRLIVEETSQIQSPFAADQEFEQVAKILGSRCYSCHRSEVAEGDFVLENGEDLIDSGIVIPHDADSSYFIDLVVSVDDEPPLMPLDGPALSEDEVSALRDWINRGAHWPSGYQLVPMTSIDRDWWSLKPLNRPSVPDSSPWAHNAIDAFIERGLNQNQLSPNREADRRTLIRRLYFDLIGLPPKPEEVESFVHDDDPFAYERLVDLLLSSPRYGERWARHWLDIVHYADTHGYDKDKLRPNAWPYRDYVIDRLNEDIEYQRFVREQLAGDALWPEDPLSVIATGFLSAGPWDFIGHAEVPETKLDGMVARHLDRDDMVSTTLNVFSSLTVQCARCHDHKLDPVTMTDYYRLQAVFAAIDRADQPIDLDPDVARKRAELSARMTEAQQDVDDVVRSIEESKTPEILELESRLRAVEDEITRHQPQLGDEKSEENPIARSPAYGFHSQVSDRPDEPKWIQVDLGRTTPISQVVIWAADEWGWSDFGFPTAYQIEVSNDVNFETSQLIFESPSNGSVADAAIDLADASRPGGYPVVINATDVEARYVRMTATRLWNRRHRRSDGSSDPLTNDWIFAVGELGVWHDGKQLSISRVSAKDSIEALPRWGQSNVADRIVGRYGIDRWLESSSSSPMNGFHSQFADESNSLKWIEFDLGEPQLVDLIVLVPAFPTDWTDTPGFGFPSTLVVELSTTDDFTEASSMTLARDGAIGSVANRWIRLEVEPTAVQFVRFSTLDLWDRGEGKHALAFAEIQIFAQGASVGQQALVTASDSIESGRWSIDGLTDGHSSRIRLEDTRDIWRPRPQLSELRQTRQQIEATLQQQLDDLIPDALTQRHRELSVELEELQKDLDELPPKANVYTGTVHNGSGNFRGRGGLGPREIHVLHRGEVSHPLDRVEPGTVPLIGGETGSFALDELHDEAERRIALANWLTSDQHPLAWRSIANRMWQYHFGVGLCDTSNDFGRGGGQPSHPELLDWLACEIRDGGQSLKQLHRLICTSATYRQASRLADDSQSSLAKAIDGDNRLLWRMNRRRLSAEEIRDAMLLIAGELNLQMGGPGFQDFVIEHPEHSPHYEYDAYMFHDRKTFRRAVYRFIVRSQPQPFMTSLDCADPSISVPQRDETTTAIQALAMLNNRLVLRLAERMGEQIDSSQLSRQDAVALAFYACTGRQPVEQECQLLESYANEHGLENLCLVLFNMSEFLFID